MKLKNNENVITINRIETETEHRIRNNRKETESIIIMTKNTANSTITKLLLLNVRDLLRQQTCGDAHSQVIFFDFATKTTTTTTTITPHSNVRQSWINRDKMKPDHFTPRWRWIDWNETLACATASINSGARYSWKTSGNSNMKNNYILMWCTEKLHVAWNPKKLCGSRLGLLCDDHLGRERERNGETVKAKRTNVYHVLWTLAGLTNTYVINA